MSLPASRGVTFIQPRTAVDAPPPKAPPPPEGLYKSLVWFTWARLCMPEQETVQPEVKPCVAREPTQTPRVRPTTAARAAFIEGLFRNLRERSVANR